MSNQENPKVLPKLSEDKTLKSERHIPETIGNSVGCEHDFILKGYEVICSKCPIGLFVSSYQDYLNLVAKTKKT